MSFLGTIFTLLCVFFETKQGSLSDKLWPFVMLLIGTSINTFGDLLKQNFFQKYEFSEKRFFGLEAFWSFTLIAFIIYPLISSVSCENFRLLT